MRPVSRPNSATRSFKNLLLMHIATLSSCFAIGAYSLRGSYPGGSRWTMRRAAIPAKGLFRMFCGASTIQVQR